ncbi:MAG TPA: FAD-dependent monooxygenase [Burkholderiales bacterium]|jgi:2-polyprenyl-6-methoxyphenol hydroxylase-like FAD-dependent oxidoreductase
MIEVPVLIVGGGPVGLSTSILLSRLGVASRLVERHPTTAFHPKARNINMRTMEVFRQCGVEEAVRAAGLAFERTVFLIFAESLAGREIERRVPRRSNTLGDAPSGVRHCLCAQDDLEPVLRRHAEALAPGTLAFGTELTRFEQDATGVTATVRDAGGERRIRAQYLIAADGARSRVRPALGIPLHGVTEVYRSVNVLMNANLSQWVKDRPAAIYLVQQPGLRCTFLTINGVNRWGFLINLPVGASFEPYTPEHCAAVVRTAAGVPDLEVRILGIDPWVAASLVADRFRAGRVFLAGDAAHEMPPTGGFGLNTGVQDAHNLAWKLAAVLRGWARPELLDTYDAERRPWGQFVTDEALNSALSMGRGRQLGGDSGDPPSLARPEFHSELGVIFGATYASPAVIPDGTDPPAIENPVAQYVPSARPGSRAPHVWLQHNGHRISTHDLIGMGFVLLAGERGAPWRDAARTVAASLGVPLTACTVGANADVRDPQGQWALAYGVEPEGAVLVRPDGHVAWRQRSGVTDPERALERALRGMLLGRA